MPSGAKKRKAAKKKKENQSNTNNNQPQHSQAGDEDLKHQSQEDKDSDVGEVSSPASQDHRSHKSIITSEGEGEEVETKESEIEGVGEPKPAEEEERSIQVEREFNTEDEPIIKNGSSKNDEAALKSYDGGSSGSSSSDSNSSSDEESNDDAKISQQNVVDASDSLSEKPIEISQSPAIEETDDSIVEKSHVFDSEKVPSLSERVEVVGSQTVDSVIPSTVESLVEENGKEKKSSVDDRVDSSIGSGEITRAIEEKDDVSEPRECAPQESDKDLAVSYNATKPTHDIGVVSEQDSGVTLPYIAVPPRPVQSTSWKSCCGLFELFTGSGR